MEVGDEREMIRVSSRLTSFQSGSLCSSSGSSSEAKSAKDAATKAKESSFTYERP